MVVPIEQPLSVAHGLEEGQRAWAIALAVYSLCDVAHYLPEADNRPESQSMMAGHRLLRTRKLNPQLAGILGVVDLIQGRKGRWSRRNKRGAEKAETLDAKSNMERQ